MIPKRVYAKINLDNIKKNINAIRTKFGDKVSVMGIVKANGYGHGAVEVAKAMNEAGVNYFGVAAIDEAIELRQNGIMSPILILGQIFKQDFQTAIENNITCAIVDIDTAKRLSDTAISIGKKIKVHIKIDTGMGRIGFPSDENGYNQVKEVFALEGLIVEGIFTHFACADSLNKTSTYNQKQKFLAFYDKLKAEGYSVSLCHMYNSASVIDLDENCGDMVRCGIMAYGLYPSEDVNKDFTLYPAFEFKSSISFVKNVKKGFPISYGSTYVTEKEMKIATVPVGYADGYPRYLSNKGEVLVHGTRCPILGRICMDQFMIDVSHLPDVSIADEVTLIGTDKTETITVKDICDPEYRFNYEFCCLITPRVQRIYIKDGKAIDKK